MRARMLLAVASALADSPTLVLNNGYTMPRLAFAANVWPSSTCKNATATALQAGFRFIWSSVLVGEDCQRAQGEAIRESGLPRGKLFVAGTADTASCAAHADCYTMTKQAAEAQLGVLGVEYLDQVMLDYPSRSAGCDAVRGQWQALVEMYNATGSGGKLARSIGVSNFSPAQLECLRPSGVWPAVNQMQYSVGSHGTEVADAAKYGTVVQAYSPLGSGALPSDPLLVSIGSAHKKSGAQVALRWILQRNATIATQSVSAAHLAEDTAIFDFALTDAEMARLSKH